MMKLYADCPVCKRRMPVSRIASEGERHIVRCAGCGHEEIAALGEPGNSAPPAAEPPADACPKCGHPREGTASSCPRCGLVFALWKPPAEPFADFPQLAAAWQELAAEPVSGSGHDRFLEACFQQGALPDAARAYRTRLSAEPAAAARLRQIELLSQMRFVPADKAPSRRGRWIVWILFALALAAAFYLMTITPDDLMP